MLFEAIFKVDGHEAIRLKIDVPVAEDGRLLMDSAGELYVEEAYIDENDLNALGHLFKAIVDGYYNEVIVNGRRGGAPKDEGASG